MSERVDIQDSDEGRDKALQAAVQDCHDYIIGRLAAYREATGDEVQFSLIAQTSQVVEIAGHLVNFDGMAVAMTAIMTDWLERGLWQPDDDEGPLFTATFDPNKVRPS